LSTFALLIVLSSRHRNDKWCTYMPKPMYEQENITMLWNQAVNTDREVTANRPEIIIKNRKRKHAH